MLVPSCEISAAQIEYSICAAFLFPMPYTIEQHGSSYVVTGPGGKVLGRHASRFRARRQQRALYANTTEKAANYSARAGQTIAGRLARGADGKFTSGGAGKPNAKPAPKQPKTSPDQKRDQRTQERNATRDKLLASAGVDGSLVALTNGEAIDPQKAQALIDQGLAERADNGAIRATPQGRQVVNAAERGDTGMVRDALSTGRDRVGRASERRQRVEQRRTEQQQRQDARAAEQEKKRLEREAKRGGGKGDGGKPDKAAEEAKRADEKRQREEERLRKAQERDRATLMRDADKRRQADARTAAQQQRRTEVERRREEQRQQAAERSRVTTPEIADIARKLQDGETLPDDEALVLVRNNLARFDKDGNIVLTPTGLRATRQKALPFAVIKQADGRYRWIAISSNGYRDRDNEIVSTKALENDCARADADGQYGPLRWWHVPGVEIGDCDFNAVSGRMLIESGTFRNPRIAQVVAHKAAQLRLSIGFRHPPNQPDQDGVFHTIRRFERSLVPADRVANRFTQLVVREPTMLTEKIKALRTLLNGDEELVRAVLEQATATQKEADEAGIAFKAPDPVKVEAEEETEEALVEDAVEADEADDAAQYIGDMSPEAFSALLSQSFAAAIQPLLEAVNVESKMAGHLNELKSMLGGYTAKKDDEAAQQTQVLAALQQQIAAQETTLKETREQLAELLGEQPRTARGYRPTQDPATVVGDTHRLKESQPAADPFEDIANWILKPTN